MFSFLSNYQKILMIAIIFLMLAYALESFFLIKLSGNTKRGFKIWSKPLSSKAQEYLSNLDGNIIEPHQINMQTVRSFIKMEENEAIIRPLDLPPFPCIGYVNLTKPNATLEYRGGVSHFFVFLLAFAYAFYLVIPIFALILVINYWLGTWVVDDYLNKRIRAQRTI